MRRRIYGYKSAAKQRGYCFSLTDDEVKSLFDGDCYYCGTKPAQWSAPSVGSTYGGYSYNGIDRLDNSIGYVSSNCVSCCGACNRMKWVYSHTEFIQRAARIAARFPLTQLEEQENEHTQLRDMLASALEAIDTKQIV